MMVMAAAYSYKARAVKKGLEACKREQAACNLLRGARNLDRLREGRRYVSQADQAHHRNEEPFTRRLRLACAPMFCNMFISILFSRAHGNSCLQ